DLGDVVALVTIHHEIERAIVERHLRMVVAVVSGHVDLVVLERRGGQGNVRLPPFRGVDRRPRLTGRSGLAEAVDGFDEALAAAISSRHIWSYSPGGSSWMSRPSSGAKSHPVIDAVS